MMAPIVAGKDHRLLYAFVFVIGLLLFVGLLQLSSPWKYFSTAGVLLCAAVILAEARTFKELSGLFDLKKISGKGYYFVVISLLLGLLWAIIFRGYLNLPLLPVRGTLFALTAMLIGSAEEIIFRGYLQLKLRRIGIWASVIGASALHTFYKCFIFLVLPPVYYTDYLYFALFTFTMGCLLGLVKEYGRSTWIPVSGHAFFDLLVYGDRLINAWWVWM